MNSPRWPGSEPFSRATLQTLMWECAGLERTEAGLARAAAALDAWAAASALPRTQSEHEDANLLLVARHLVAAARARTTSAGAHFRADETRAHPNTGAHPDPGARADTPASHTIGAPAC